VIQKKDKNSTCWNNGIGRAEQFERKWGKIYVYGERDRTRKEGAWTMAKQFIEKKKNQLNKEKVKYILVNTVSSMDAQR
jgi:hypothetical protein